jgi:hypothetical protein
MKWILAAFLTFSILASVSMAEVSKSKKKAAVKKTMGRKFVDLKSTPASKPESKKKSKKTISVAKKNSKKPNAKKVVDKKVVPLPFVMPILPEPPPAMERSTASETTVSPSGKSTLVPEVFTQKEEDRFVYRPVDPEVWKKVEDFIAKKKYEDMVEWAAVKVDASEKGSPESNEFKLALAIALREYGLSHMAFIYLSEIIKAQLGTSLGEAGLHEMDLLVQRYYYDTTAIDSILNSNEFTKLHADTQSFVSYHRALYNKKMGFHEWAERDLARIQPESFWAYKLKYQAALLEVESGQNDKALESLTSLEGDAKTPAVLLEDIKLQIARLEFEKGQFTEAYALYTGLKMPLREWGRLTVERAWSKYYLGDYSKSLGILESVEAPYFDSTVIPERYVLKMIIHRQLCHYKVVEKVAREFYSRFKRSIATIKKRGDLRSDKTLARASLLTRPFQFNANYIYQLRQEEMKLDDGPFAALSFQQPMLHAYRQKDEEMQMQIDGELESVARKNAADILDIAEQVDFVTYTSKLDALRIVRQGEKREYTPERIDYLKFDKVFWPQEEIEGQREFWTDELEDYKVLISSRCSEESPRNKKAEETFR